MVEQTLALLKMRDIRLLFTRPSSCFRVLTSLLYFRRQRACEHTKRCSAHCGLSWHAASTPSLKAPEKQRTVGR